MGVLGSTLTELLREQGFDFQTGLILHQNDEEGNIEKISPEHPILHQRFDTGFGSAEMPRFIAYDPVAVYFPGVYDGATWIEKVFLSPGPYLGKFQNLPYVGGGG